MRKYSLSSLFDIQLFGEGAGGAAGAAGAGGEGPAGQNTAAVAQPQQTGEQKSSAPTRGSGAKAPDAGERQSSPQERSARFEELIKGEFKDLYDKRVQETIRRRLRGSEENARRLDALFPALEELGKRYGVDPEDTEALSRAVREESAARAKREEEAGAAEELRRDRARRQVSDWLRQAEALQDEYPAFDLRKEAADPRFRQLLGSGVPLRTAFEVLHQGEILPAAMAYSARRAEERLAESVIAGQRRPAEGAMGSQGPVISKRDVSRLTRAEREEIDRRVARGEKIRF